MNKKSSVEETEEEKLLRLLKDNLTVEVSNRSGRLIVQVFFNYKLIAKDETDISPRYQ